MKTKKEIFLTPGTENAGVRINKYLADAGICSRREGDKAIEDGLVTIDGEKAVMGSRVFPGQHVTYRGKDISKVEDLVLIAFNKPVGIVCTTDKRDPDNIIDFISYEKRIFPIGRLDKDSEGLILLTNDGNIVNKILRAGNFHEKEYIVTVNKPITPEFLRSIASGVPILDTVTRPCTIEQIDNMTFRIILTQGLNRQIRRMCEALDYRVRALTRVRIMNINLGRLKTGTYRNLTELEINKLKELIADSSNAPVSGSMREDSEGMLDEDMLRESVHSTHVTAKEKALKRTQSNYHKTAGELHEYRRKETADRRADRTSFKSSKGVRTGRPGNHK